MVAARTGALISRLTDIAVVGAGPYGLSIAAHLRGLGLDFRIFGAPLETWRRMPPGMQLKSDGFASCLSAPGGVSTLREYCAEQGIAYHDTNLPVQLSTFVDYGLAFQRRHAPDLEPGTAVSIARGGPGFRIAFADGQVVEARQVVLAVGITHFDYTPEAFAGFPADLVSHSSANGDFSAFAGRDVTVLGAGSSAVDMALGLAEAGARPRLVARREAVRFSAPAGRRRSLINRILHPPSGLGNGLRSRLACDAPDVFRMLPSAARLGIVRRHLGPISPAYQQVRLEAEVEVLAGRHVAGVSGGDGRVRLDLVRADGGTEAVETEHVICATGYRADLRRLGFLDPALRAEVRTVGHAPRLSPWFESSARGLYFVGNAAAATFGPVMRFMYGDDFAARRISARLARTAAG